MFKFIVVLLVCAVQMASALTQETTKGKELSVTVAEAVAQKAIEYARTKSWKVSVAVVNSEGNLVFFKRDDGSYSGSIEAAQQKARSANAFRRPTSAFVEALKQGRLGLFSIRDVVPVEGGVPILFKGEHVGGIGVSGAKAIEDEETANAALTTLIK